MKPTVRVHAYRTEPLTHEWRKEVRNANQIVESAELDFNFEYREDLLDGVELESDDDIREQWLKNQLRDVVTHVIYVHLTPAEWDAIGIDDDLWGQARVVGNTVVCYGRWFEGSSYENSQHYAPPVNKLSEQSIGLAHELGHGLNELLNPNQRDNTHFHFYGKTGFGDEHDRWERTPTPGRVFEQLNWARLPGLDTKYTKESSRDPEDLHPKLAERWFWLKDYWQEEYPNEPEVKLSCTYRNKEDQTKQFQEGDSDARWKESLHNFQPAYAFDIYFEEGGEADWSWHLYKKFSGPAKGVGLEWGGDWEGVQDGPHFQMPMTFHDAQSGDVPDMKALEDTTYYKLVKRRGLLRQVVKFLEWLVRQT